MFEFSFVFSSSEISPRLPLPIRGIEDQSCFENNSSPILLEKRRHKRRNSFLFIFVACFCSGAKGRHKRRNVWMVTGGKGFSLIKNLIAESSFPLATFCFVVLNLFLLITYWLPIHFASSSPSLTFCLENLLKLLSFSTFQLRSI